MNESIEIKIMRMMAWERAKGEMKSMLETYHCNIENYEKFEKLFSEFVKEVEDNGLQE